MNENFDYFALSYLNTWLDFDKGHIQRLAGKGSGTPRDALVEIAIEYKVSRCFPIDMEGERRLGPIMVRLRNATKPRSQRAAKEEVAKLKGQLSCIYKQDTLSASSKFLWFKYQSLIVIYDSRAVATLREYGLNRKPSYAEYYEKWKKIYPCYDERIQESCGRLSKALKYTTQGSTPGKRECVEKISNEQWFRDRVFDKFLYINGGK